MCPSPPVVRAEPSVPCSPHCHSLPVCPLCCIQSLRGWLLGERGRRGLAQHGVCRGQPSIQHPTSVLGSDPAPQPVPRAARANSDDPQLGSLDGFPELRDPATPHWGVEGWFARRRFGAQVPRDQPRSGSGKVCRTVSCCCYFCSGGGISLGDPPPQSHSLSLKGMSDTSRGVSFQSMGSNQEEHSRRIKSEGCCSVSKPCPIFKMEKLVESFAQRVKQNFLPTPHPTVTALLQQRQRIHDIFPDCHGNLISNPENP